MCKAVLDQCALEGYNDIFLSYVNKSRDSNYNSTWTYADLYQAFPFDNVVYITEITGVELLREVKGYNFIFLMRRVFMLLFFNLIFFCFCFFNLFYGVY